METPPAESNSDQPYLEVEALKTLVRDTSKTSSILAAIASLLVLSALVWTSKAFLNSDKRLNAVDQKADQAQLELRSLTTEAVAVGQSSTSSVTERLRALEGEQRHLAAEQERDSRAIAELTQEFQKLTARLEGSTKTSGQKPASGPETHRYSLEQSFQAPETHSYSLEMSVPAPETHSYSLEQTAPTTNKHSESVAEGLLNTSWKLNKTGSKMPAGIFYVVSSTYVAKSDQIKICSDEVDNNGNAVHVEWIGKFDGKDYRVTGTESISSRSYDQVDANTLLVTNWKNGKLVGTSRIAISPDGKIQTAYLTQTDPSGKTITGTAVYDEQ